MKALLFSLVIIAGCTPPAMIHELPIVRPSYASCEDTSYDVLISDHTLTLSVHKGLIVEALTWREGVYQRGPLDVLVDTSLDPRVVLVEGGWCAIGPLVGDACLVEVWREKTCFIDHINSDD